MEIPSILDSARTRAGRPLRFLAAGAVNTAIGLLVYPALLWLFSPLREHYLVALAISQVFCVVMAYTIYRLTVFRSKGKIFGEFLRFASYYGAIYAVNWVALPLLVEIGGIDPLISQVAFTAAVTIGSYFWHSNVTFQGGANE